MKTGVLNTLAALLVTVLALIGMCPAAWAQNLVITTVAGSDFVFRGDGAPATQAQFSQMYDVITDPQGNVLVADRSNHQVVKIAPSGILSVIAGNGISGYSGDGGPAANASLSFPSALALDRAGNIYIGDTGNYRIRRITSDGMIDTIAGTGLKGFAGDGGQAASASIDSVLGLAIDALGNIYFTESKVHRVRRITTDGIVRTYAGNGAGAFAGDNGPANQASLNEPWHLTIDSGGNLLIADFRNHRLRRVTPAGIITTVAGTGTATSNGDGGPAAQATLLGPAGVYVDSSNNIYTTGFDNRVRIIGPDGIIRAFAGTGSAGFAGDGGPAAQALLAFPVAITGDSTGNIYFADTLNLRVRRITRQGIVSTYAGIVQHRYSGDGGQAVAAAIGLPLGLAVDTDNNVYISDPNNHRIRKVSPNGIISTIAGTGLAGFSGDNGPSTLAALNFPTGLASDLAGNVYIADTLNGRVRRISRDGTIATVAGGGPRTAIPVDGQLATEVTLAPQSLAVDLAGNLFILDPALCAVLRVTNAGRIFRHAGQLLKCGSSGDGGPATSAAILPPGDLPGGGIAADIAGNVYIAEPNPARAGGGGRVRRVGLDGIITTFAGNGQFGFPNDGDSATSALAAPLAVVADAVGAVYIADISVIYGVLGGRIARLAGNFLATGLGDGGPPREAAMGPGALAFDRNGNLLLSDLTSARVRAILVQPPALAAAPQSLQFAAPSGGAPALPQNISVTASIPNVAFALKVTTSNGERWLQAVPGSGASPRLVEVTADPANLSPGAYTGMIEISAPLATPPVQSIPVTFAVSPGQAARLGIDKQNFSFGFPRAAAPRTQTLVVRNRGGGPLDFTVSVSTKNGGSWLTVDPPSGRAFPAAPVTVSITAAPGNLPPDTYTGVITVSTGAETANVPVTMTISANDRAILLSQTGLSFTAVSGGGIVPVQAFQVLNTGRGIVRWTVSTSTLSGGPNWLRATPANGSTDAGSEMVPAIEVRVDQTGLAPGNYYGLVRVDAPDAANSPQLVTVFLEVLPAGSDPGPIVEPGEVVFTGVTGRSSPGSKAVFVYNIAAAPKTFRSTTTFSGAGGAGDVRLVNLPTDLTLATDQPNRVIVQPFIGNLPPGVYTGSVNMQFTDGTVRTVRIKVILLAGESRGALRFAEACTPTKLLPAITSLAQSARVTAGWPVPVTAEVRDDCGSMHTTGSVVASFSNGDPPVALQSLKDGRWSGTWPSRAAVSIATTIKVEAVNPVQQIKGDQTLNVDIRARQDPPVVEPGDVVSAAGFQPFIPLAPGGLISIYGDRLAEVTQSATSLPLPKQIASTQVVMGGVLLPLLFVSPNQINALVPAGLEPNTTHQLLVQRANTYARPVALDVAAAQPAVFLDTSVSSTQGLILFIRGSGETGRARPGSPAQSGDVLVIYATGMGATNPAVPDGAPPPDSAPVRTRDAVTATVGGISAPVDFAGLAPGFVGLYQMNARVPSGVAPGDQVPVVLSVSNQSSQPVTIAVR